MNSNNKTPIIDADKVEDIQPTHEETPKKEKKKSSFKFHLILMLILGVGTWAFITYSQTAKDWKQQWYDFTHQPTETAAPYTAPTVVEEPEPTVEEVYTEEPVNEAPILEDIQELPTVEVEPADALNAESLADLSSLVGQLQSQLANLQDNLNQMYSQQSEQTKQQARAQIYATLQKAASTNNSIEDSATAWKSISLMPMLDESRRAEAEQAWNELNGISSDVQTLTQEIISDIRDLADKLHPEALADVAETIDNLVDEYANTDAWMTWVDWLKDQFHISKVNQHAVTISDDPYADLKHLIGQLDQLKNVLNSGQWQSLPDLNALTHQLEQYGIETSVSSDVIEHMQQTQQAWQEQAKAWMEQL